MSEHLPECMWPKNDGTCEQCQFFECECTCICDRLRACEARVIGAAVQRVEAIADDPDSGVDWNWDYDIDPTGMTKNPLVWIREAVAAIKKVEQ